MTRNIYALIILLLFGFSSTVVGQFGDPVPRYPQEMDGPVNMKNRSLYFSATDLAIPGRGIGIEFTRYHNSAGIHGSTNGTSYIGPKWNHNYQWEIRFGGSRSGYTWVWRDGQSFYERSPYTVTIITGSGTKQSFTASGSRLDQSGWESRATFSPKTGVRASLKFEQ